MNTTWAVSVQEWDGACYHERIVGPFRTEEEAEDWGEASGSVFSAFDLMPPHEWQPAGGGGE